jgi:hypothetical protein
MKHDTSSGTPVEISEAKNKAGHKVNRKQVQKQLSRMKAETARLLAGPKGALWQWQGLPGVPDRSHGIPRIWRSPCVNNTS